MSAFDDLMDEALDAGVDPDWVDRVKKASAGSPLRKERDEAKAALESAIADANRWKGAVLATRFREHSIDIDPNALNIPTDLDPADGDRFQAWAQEMRLIKPPPPATPPEEQAAYQQMLETGQGATQQPHFDARDEVLAAGAAGNAAEFWAKARAAGMLAEGS